MSGRAQLMWNEAVTAYDFGAGHPMDPVRLALTMRLTESLVVPRARELAVCEAPAADDPTLRLVHRQEYIDAVRKAAADPTGARGEYGIGTLDDPAFPAMHTASALIAGMSVTAAESIWGGEAAHAVNFCGGLHHAMPGAASGFCVYNDPAVAIRRLLELGAQRVAYLDTDVHHGDGVQTVFWDDPRVLTISLHEDPGTLFPGTGWAEESGGAEAPGLAVNVPLPAGTSDAGWLRALHAVVPEALEAFAPEVLVTQHGADAHVDDPLAHLALSVDAQRAAAEACHEWAHRYAQGRWLALGGGGYAVVEVVPRTWTHLVGIAAGAPVESETEVPPEWLAEAYARTGEAAQPRRMTDGRTPSWRSWESGYDPADALDRTVMRARRAAFPALGLLP